jgi:hypothetical protein
MSEEEGKTSEGETYDPVTGQILEERKKRNESIVLREKAKTFLRSGYAPGGMFREDQVITIARAGAELGIPFYAALRSIFIVDGKIALESALMRGLVLRKVKGARIDFLEVSSERCVVEMQRPGGRINTFVYTIDDAKQAGLLGKSNWKKNPISMLMNRASSIGCKALFADVLLGLGGSDYEFDEYQDMIDNEDEEVKIELDRLRESIYSLASALPEDRKSVCLQQTESALSQRNVNLLTKILKKLRDFVEGSGEKEIRDAEIVDSAPNVTNGDTENHV